MLSDTLSTCGACTEPPVVQWRRRSADDPDATEPVFACGQHPISLDLAAHVHAPACSAPDPKALPGCDCTPEPLPQPEPITTTTVLPTGWTVPEAPLA
jgi:hypothetical protein